MLKKAFEMIQREIAKRKLPKVRRCMIEFANDPGHPVEIRKAIPDYEKGIITVLMKGHGKKREFSVDEVNAILVETREGEIVRFDKTEGEKKDE